jgi:nuclease S1
MASPAAAIGLAWALAVGCAGPARAWGDEGHRIVAEIAERYLEPETAREMRALLAIEGATTLVEVSTWADDIRRRRRETAPWHYVNIPLHPPAGTHAGFDAARDCPGGDCVVAAIERFVAVLSDKRAPPRDRLEALKFVVHLVADVHQPLDCANNGDRGGNDVHIVFLGRHTTLHAMWDWGILEPAVNGDEHGYARRLVAAIDATDAARWQAGAAADWANESFRIARAWIYGEMQPEARMLEIFQGSEFLPVVNQQLQRAGVRLAAVLNRAAR